MHGQQLLHKGHNAAVTIRQRLHCVIHAYNFSTDLHSGLGKNYSSSVPVMANAEVFAGLNVKLTPAVKARAQSPSGGIRGSIVRANQ